MVKITAGIDTMELTVAGNTVSEVTERVEGLLNLSGTETTKVNGVEVSGSYTLHDGDTLEFVKDAGKKGSVNIVSGIDKMTLEVDGKTVEEIVSTTVSILNLSGDETVKVNGIEVDADYILKDGDVVEFVKDAGKKGMLIE